MPTTFEPPPPLDPRETLRHIGTLARAAQESSDIEMMQKHIELILALVDKALPKRRRTDK